MLLGILRENADSHRIVMCQRFKSKRLQEKIMLENIKLFKEIAARDSQIR